MGGGCVGILAAAGLMAAGAALGAGSAAPLVEGPTRTDDGLLVYTVTSEYQRGPNAVEVLLPDRLEEGRRYPVLYVLPVNAGTEGRWGRGIVEAKRQDVANRHGLIAVAPAFDALPWYADHPTDPSVRQESYLLRVVLPLVESRHPALAEARGRLLVGFSKSGWGAFCLLLRHPDVFGRAAAWDAPLMEAAPARFGMAEVFATAANFEAYRVAGLLERRADLLRTGPPRLVLLGFDNFREATAEAHARMAALGIPHLYDNATRRPHHWHSGWFADAVSRLMRDTP